MDQLPRFLKNFKLSTSNLLSVALVIIGLYLLSNKVIFPVIYSYASDTSREPVLNPVNEIDLSYQESDTSGITNFTFDELNEQAEKHLSATLFDEAQSNTLKMDESDTNTQDYFYLSIPKLDIYDAIVEIDSSNMNPRENIAHFKGTCLPGDGCNAFIYGHSTFKYFKNRYKEGDYSGVFTKLDELEYGDEFIIKYNGETYNYVVDFTRVQNPLEVDPLSNPYPSSIGKHQSTVELFTCTQPGTTKYRLSVVGKLVD